MTEPAGLLACQDKKLRMSGMDSVNRSCTIFFFNFAVIKIGCNFFVLFSEGRESYK